jgi:hypothetical protein
MPHTSTHLIDPEGQYARARNWPALAPCQSKRLRIRDVPDILQRNAHAEGLIGTRDSTCGRKRLAGEVTRIQRLLNRQIHAERMGELTDPECASRATLIAVDDDESVLRRIVDP